MPMEDVLAELDRLSTLARLEGDATHRASVGDDIDGVKARIDELFDDLSAFSSYLGAGLPERIDPETIVDRLRDGVDLVTTPLANDARRYWALRAAGLVVTDGGLPVEGSALDGLADEMSAPAPVLRSTPGADELRETLRASEGLLLAVDHGAATAEKAERLRKALRVLGGTFEPFDPSVGEKAIVVERGSWWVTGPEWSGPWKSLEAAELAGDGELVLAHDANRTAAKASRERRP